MNRKKLKIIGISVLSILIVGLVSYAAVLYFSVTKTADKVHVDLKESKSDKREEKVDLKKLQPFSVLLLGSDSRGKDMGRSDTMIIATVNPNTNCVKMLSVPRDTRVQLPGYKGYHKINAAYSYGGPELAMKTVENLFDIPIDYFVRLNFNGMKDMVDAVSGVTVQNDLDFTYEGHHFPPGNLQLDGEKALSYTRMRYDDPRGDYGRQLRQQAVIKEVVKDGLNFSSIFKLQEFFNVIGDNVKTNLTLNEIWDMKNDYAKAANNIESLQVNAFGAYIKDNPDAKALSYQLIFHDEQVRVINFLRTQLELPLKDPNSYPNIDPELKRTY